MSKNLFVRVHTAVLLLLMVPSAALAQEGDQHPDWRDDVAIRLFTGISIDSFAASDLSDYRNPDDSGDVQEQLIAGFDFEYRMVGDASGVGTWPQLWLYGETVHGVRSGDTDCTKQPHTDICIKPAPPRENSLNSGAASLAIFRKATSFEGFAGLRLDLLPLRRNTTAASTLYVKGQLGFLTVAGQAGDVRDIHHAALGLMLTNGPLAGSYFEIGRGINDCFLDGKKRFKLDALVLFDTGRAVTPFAQLVVDADMGDGPDSIQSYFGFHIDVRGLLR